MIHRAFAIAMTAAVALIGTGINDCQPLPIEVVDGDASGSDTVTSVPDTPDTSVAADPDCPQADDFWDVSGLAVNSGYDAPTLSVACDGDDVVIQSNGIPTFAYMQVTPNALAAQNHAWRIPRVPTVAAEPGDVPLVGTAAISVTGMPIFGPTEAPRDGSRDPYLDGILDYCNGHTAPGGVYHFHARPECLLEGQDGVPYVVVAYALDGYPILSPWVCEDAECVTVSKLESGWQQVEAQYGATVEAAWEAHTFVGGTALDRCNGMTLSDGSYAYFATDTFPYLMGCYRGEVGNQTTTAGAGDGQGAPPDGRPGPPGAS